MKALDLHGVKHRDVGNRVDTFIRQNKQSLPIKIITGNSLDMQNIVKGVVNLYRLSMRSESAVNLGSYIIDKPLDPSGF